MAECKLGLALQGGGTHGAFTWGVLDRLLEEVEAGRFSFEAISAASAGAINAVIVAAALGEGGPAMARARLTEFWRNLADRGKRAGNALFGFGEPGPFGWNIDGNPAAIFWEAMGLVFSPYTNPFYSDTLTPLLLDAFPAGLLAGLNAGKGPKLLLSAVNVATCARQIFSQPDISIDVIRASCCLPAEFKAVHVDGADYWDGGFLGNPALSPLIDATGLSDVLLVMVNPLNRTDMPPRGARAILDRLNEITFNASVVLEMNAIEAVNRLLAEVREQGQEYTGRYRPVNLHLIEDDAFMSRLGFVSKSSTSWPFLQALHREGRRVASKFIHHHGDKLGQKSSVDVKAALTGPVLKCTVRPASAADADDGT